MFRLPWRAGERYPSFVERVENGAVQPDSEYAEYLEFAGELSAASGEVILKHYEDPRRTLEYKSDDSPVTAADREAEAVLRELILRRYPGHGILGEEHGTTKGESDWVWVLDPIDGTKSFVSGCPLFGTLIGLCHRGLPVVGAIHQPVVGQLLLGDCQSAWLNGKRVHVRPTSRVSEAVLLTTDVEAIEAYRGSRGFSLLRSRAAMVRTWGDCYGYLLVASGGADIMIDPVMNPWDLLPLIPVIKGAGGVITSWEGRPAHEGHSCVASATPALHAEVLESINMYTEFAEG